MDQIMLAEQFFVSWSWARPLFDVDHRFHSSFDGRMASLQRCIDFFDEIDRWAGSNGSSDHVINFGHDPRPWGRNVSSGNVPSIMRSMGQRMIIVGIVQCVDQLTDKPLINKWLNDMLEPHWRTHVSRR